MKKDEMKDLDWHPYDGDYEKNMQDIKLSDGTVHYCCWPNAGFWNCSGTPEPIHHRRAKFVRLTHNRDQATDELLA